MWCDWLIACAVPTLILSPGNVRCWPVQVLAFPLAERAAEGEAIVQRREQARAAEEAAARAPEVLEERLREQLHAVFHSVGS